MSISKAQLKLAEEAAFNRGQQLGIASARKALEQEYQTRRFRDLEDALINLNGLAQANAQIATAIAQALRLINERP